MTIKWSVKKFTELSLQELYELLQLRSEVFVVEQKCAFQDMDDKDQKCLHLLGMQDGKLIAYTRLVPPGVSYGQGSIGRVVTSPSARGGGLGRQLMDESIKQMVDLYGENPIRIGAQL